MNDDKIKRMDKSYTAAAVKDGKSVMFLFRSTPCLFLEVHQVNCSAAQMFFLNEKIIPTDLPKKRLILASSFI